MVQHSRPRLVASAVMAVAGGTLMVDGGFATHSFLLSILGVVQSGLGSLLGGLPAFVAEAAVAFVALLVGLGGFTVAVGGLLIYSGHITSGRLLIALGGGAGFVGLLVSFGYTAFTSGVAVALGHSLYWLGLVLAIAARRVAKKA